MLTPKEHACLSYVETTIAATGGVSPSYHEIMRALGLHSKSGVSKLLDALIAKGKLRRLDGRQRALTVVDNGRKRVAKPTVHYENAVFYTWDYTETDPKKQMKPWQPEPAKPRE